MTTRQTLKRTNIGHSKSLEALMVHIDWTDARVVRIEARRDFTLQASTIRIWHDEYTPLHDAPVSVNAGQVLYFCQSDGFPGWYYVLTYNSVSFSCSCPPCYHYHRACSHQQHALVFVGHRATREQERRVKLEHAIMPDWQQYVEDGLRQARQEQVYENLVSSSSCVEESSVEYRAVA